MYHPFQLSQHYYSHFTEEETEAQRGLSKLLSITAWQMPTPSPSRPRLGVVSHVTWNLLPGIASKALHLAVTAGCPPVGYRYASAIREVSKQMLFSFIFTFYPSAQGLAQGKVAINVCWRKWMDDRVMI